MIGPAVVLYRGRDPGGAYHLEAAYPVDDEVDGGGSDVASWCRPTTPSACGGGGRWTPRSGLPRGVRRRRAAGGRPHHRPALRRGVPAGAVRTGAGGGRPRGRGAGADHDAGVGRRNWPPASSGWPAPRCAGGSWAGRPARRPRPRQAQWAAWAGEVLGRLDAAVPDPACAGQAVKGCAHRFPDWRIEQMRARYRELGSLDALLVEMRLDHHGPGPVVVRVAGAGRGHDLRDQGPGRPGGLEGGSGRRRGAAGGLLPLQPGGPRPARPE